ncbi:MAG: restriction endonuclease [Gammaproteobacteria bacterium]
MKKLKEFFTNSEDVLSVKNMEFGHRTQATLCTAALKTVLTKKNIEKSDLYGYPKAKTSIDNGYLIIEISSQFKILSVPKKIELNFFLESNFFGTVLNFQIPKLSYDVNFEYSEDNYALIKSGKVKIFNFNDSKNEKSLYIDSLEVNSQEDHLEKEFPGCVCVPTFLKDDDLFLLSQTYLHIKRDPSFKKPFYLSKDELLKLDLKLSWLNNLAFEIRYFYNLVSFYSSQLENKEIDGGYEYLSRRLDNNLSDEEALSENQISIIGHWLKALDVFKANKNEFKKLLFSSEWVENFSYLDYINNADIWEYLPSFMQESNLCHKLPALTQEGQRYCSFSNEGKIISTELIPTKGYKELAKFWDRWFPDLLFENTKFLNGTEIPVTLNQLNDFLKVYDEGAIPSVEFDEIFYSIAKEIEEDAEYCLHTDVTFDLQNSFFPIVVINKGTNDYYHCIFITPNNEFFKIIFNIRGGSISHSSHRNTEIEYKQGLEHLCLICLSMIRDFLVPEYREKIYKSSTLKRKNKYGSKFKNSNLQITYVPRVKYVYVDSKATLENYKNNFPYRSKSLHSVRPHLRILKDDQKASNEALMNAKKYGFEIKANTTFVSPHEKGGMSNEQKRIYRSRSILTTFFAEKETSQGDMPHWFKFEHDVKRMFEKNGFVVSVTKSTNDGGIDVEGLDAEGNIVLISCKCWSPNRKVERSQIEELAGTVERFKRTQHYEKDKKVRGIFATTSSYSPGGQSAAEDLDIELFDGEALENLDNLNEYD